MSFSPNVPSGEKVAAPDRVSKRMIRFHRAPRAENWAIIIMLRSKRTLFTVAVLSFVRIAQADGIQCPQFPSANANMKQHALADASLFVGPPNERVELMPDTDKDTVWTLADYQDEARQHTTSLYIVCRYKNTRQTVGLMVPATAQKCAVSYDQHNNLIARCQ